MHLTRDEIILIAFVIVSLVVGAFIKNYRARLRTLAPSSHLSTPVQPAKPPTGLRP